ncbi:protein FAM177B [Tiliqua scincoides]|uniref:protein FAM177B n=1 Tax=Tiliqua scincoides TaxID=71010 RepID=UPI003462CCA2
MGDSQEILKRQEGGGQQQEDTGLPKEKPPRRIIHFTSGESMEEYSTEEEDTAEEGRELLLDTAKLSWGTYLRFWALRIATTTFFTCEFLGGKLATLFGLNEPKYQYAINEYYRTQRQGNESDEDGEVVEGVSALNEEQHLEMQSLGYGSIHHEDVPVFSQKDAVENVNELGKDSCLPDPKCNPVAGK